MNFLIVVCRTRCVCVCCMLLLVMLCLVLICMIGKVRVDMKCFFFFFSCFNFFFFFFMFFDIKHALKIYTHTHIQKKKRALGIADEKISEISPGHHITYSIVAGPLPLLENQSTVSFTPRSTADGTTNCVQTPPQTLVKWQVDYTAKPGFGWAMPLLLKPFMKALMWNTYRSLQKLYVAPRSTTTQ